MACKWLTQGNTILTQVVSSHLNCYDLTFYNLTISGYKPSVPRLGSPPSREATPCPGQTRTRERQQRAPGRVRTTVRLWSPRSSPGRGAACGSGSGAARGHPPRTSRRWRTTGPSPGSASPSGERQEAGPSCLGKYQETTSFRDSVSAGGCWVSAVCTELGELPVVRDARPQIVCPVPVIAKSQEIQWIQFMFLWQ